MSNDITRWPTNTRQMRAGPTRKHSRWFRVRNLGIFLTNRSETSARACPFEEGENPTAA